MNYRTLKNAILNSKYFEAYRVQVHDNHGLYTIYEFPHMPCYSHVGIIWSTVRRLQGGFILITDIHNQ